MAKNINQIIQDHKDDDNGKFIAIINGQLINPGEKAKKADILIYKDKVIAIAEPSFEGSIEKAANLHIIDAKDKFITPGLIDQHIHGGYGCDFNTASTEEIIDLAKNLPQHGITSILPTVMTAPEEIIKDQINKIREAKKNLPDNATKFPGIHLEGPYLCAKYKGIQPENNIAFPSIENFKKIEDPEIKIVSYAPELDKNLELTKYLADKKIIPSAGHTSASMEQIENAARSGLKQVTHLFNAMPPLHHRNPGITGESLINDNLYVEVIADGLHINPAVINLILRAKPHSKVIFISDSLPLNKAGTDNIIFGGQKIFKKDNKAVNADGTLAGSLIFLDSTIRNLKAWNLADFSDSLKYTSLNAAQNLGLENLGYIDNDKTADIVLWDKDYNVNMTIINGKVAFK